MRQLMPMVDYTLLPILDKFSKHEIDDNNKNDRRILDLTKNIEYAKLLNTDLNLGQFIPCDLDGNVLEKPRYYNVWLSEFNRGFIHEYDGNVMNRYQEAEKRVLFKGFKYEGLDNHYSEITNNNKYDSIFYDKSNNEFYDYWDKRLKKISDLVGLGIELKK